MLGEVCCLQGKAEENSEICYLVALHVACLDAPDLPMLGKGDEEDGPLVLISRYMI